MNLMPAFGPPVWSVSIHETLANILLDLIAVQVVRSSRCRC
ncbi:MAG TPA: hypothetical protein VNJ10_09780 [Sphingomonas sp.]|nr:hypothetical protein [Sphingomonas sp.]